MIREVGQYVEGCDLCQQMKNRMEEVAGKLKVGRSSRKAMDAYISGLYYQVTDCSRKGCNLGSLR